MSIIKLTYCLQFKKLRFFKIKESCYLPPPNDRAQKSRFAKFNVDRFPMDVTNKNCRLIRSIQKHTSHICSDIIVFMLWL